MDVKQNIIISNSFFEKQYLRRGRIDQYNFNHGKIKIKRSPIIFDILEKFVNSYEILFNHRKFHYIPQKNVFAQIQISRVCSFNKKFC